MRCQLDHLVIAAATLDAGVDYIEGKLGVRVPEGGKHPLMGTHNRLMQIGNGAFLEIIAVDPDAPRPTRRRWFSLDDPATIARIAVRPVLLTWVVRTNDIEQAVERSPFDPGLIEEGRRGDLVWKITIREDGSMAEGGVFPTLIQWPDGAGPAATMADFGCRLKTLQVAHDQPERLAAALETIGAGGIAQVVQKGPDSPSSLHAHFAGPGGSAEIS